MRARRHTAGGPPLFASGPGKRFLRDMGLVLLTFVVGYAVSALWISPAPVFSSEHALPRVLGLPEAEARSKLDKLGFRARVDGERPSATVPRGAVLWQDPPPAVVLSPNSLVQLVLSGGPAPATVPDVIGFAVPSAERVLEAAGVKLGAVDTVRGGREPGIVLASRPVAGTGRPRGSAVDLVVTGGQAGGGGL